MVVRRVINKTTVTEDLLYKRELEWIADKTAFIEFAYGLYETKAVKGIIIKKKLTKDEFVKLLAEMFGIHDIHTHAIIHSQGLSKPLEHHFPYKMEKSYEAHQIKLLERGGTLEKTKENKENYQIEEPPSKDTGKEITDIITEVTNTSNKISENIDIWLEEIKPNTK